MNDRVKRLVAYCMKVTHTNNPFEIADHLGILYQFAEMEADGCYMFLKNHRYIFINTLLDSRKRDMVMAHELGHAIMHRKNNCYFIKNKTLLLNSKVEREANLFAAELLISDADILQNIYLTTEQLSQLLGYDEQLIKLRIASYMEI